MKTSASAVNTASKLGVKALLVRVLLGELASAPDHYVRARRDVYIDMSIEELIALIDRRLAASHARATALSEALRIVSSGGRSLFDNRSERR